MKTCRRCRQKFEPGAGPKPCLDPESLQPSGTCEPLARGFALLSKEQITEISSRGGKKAQSSGVAHRFSKKEASIAGKLGGDAPHARRRGPARKSEVEG